MKWWAYLLVMAALVGAATWATKALEARGEARATAKYEVALAKQREDAQKELDAEKAKTLRTESLLKEAKLTQEKKDVENAQVISKQKRDLAYLAGTAGRLFDPNYKGAGCREGSEDPSRQVAGGARTGGEDGAEAGGLLSPELSQLLQQRAEEADNINAAYASCRADALKVRELVNPSH